jgi:hypothetical protein
MTDRKLLKSIVQKRTARRVENAVNWCPQNTPAQLCDNL